MAKVIAVCWSQGKGTPKEDIRAGILRKDYGLLRDAHACGGSHRQLSMLAVESIRKMRQYGLDLKPGDFAENLTTEGIDLISLPIGTRFVVGDKILLELTQIGKECHTGCAIFQKVGKCIMPKEGVFVRILKGGKVKAGDEIRLEGAGG